MGDFHNWNVAHTNEELALMLETGKDAINFMPTPAEKNKRYIAQMCAFLEENTSCKALSLTRCSVTSKEAVVIADMLMANTGLVYLNLSNNVIGNEGAEALARALAKNATLKFLNVSLNNFNDTGASAFVVALSNNFTLHTLKISTAFCKESTAQDIKGLLGRNRQLRKQQLREAPIRHGTKSSRKKRPHSSKKTTGYTNSLDSVGSEMSSLNPLYQQDKQLHEA